MSDPSTIVEHRDALEHLAAMGFAPLLKILREPDCYARMGCNAGQVNLGAVARKLHVSPRHARAMLLKARFAIQ